jgi:hypothetical protein
VTRQKVSIDHRPRSNRRPRRHMAPPSGSFGPSCLVSGSRKRVGDLLRGVRSKEIGNSDSFAAHHSLLPTLPGGHPSPRDAALKPVDPQGQPMEVREDPVHLLKEQVPLRGELTARCQEHPTGMGTAATG